MTAVVVELADSPSPLRRRWTTKVVNGNGRTIMTGVTCTVESGGRENAHFVARRIGEPVIYVVKSYKRDTVAAQRSSSAHSDGRAFDVVA